MPVRLEDELTCCVCLELYQQPRLLPCSHNLCHECLQRLAHGRDGRTLRRTFSCPKCRHQVEVDQWAGVSALPENRVLGDIAHLYRQGEDAIPPQLLVPTGATVCRRHPHRDPSALFCWDCKVTVCDQCVSEDHQGESHNVRIITDCVREEKAKLEDNLWQLRKVVNQQEIKFNRIQDHLKSLKEQQTSCLHSAKTDIERLIQAAFTVEKLFENAVCKDVRRLRQPLDTELDKARLLLTESQMLVESCEDVIQDGDMHQQLKTLELLAAQIHTFLQCKGSNNDLIAQNCGFIEMTKYSVLGYDDAMDAIKRIRWVPNLAVNPPPNLGVPDLSSLLTINTNEKDLSQESRPEEIAFGEMGAAKSIAKPRKAMTRTTKIVSMDDGSLRKIIAVHRDSHQPEGDRECQGDRDILNGDLSENEEMNNSDSESEGTELERRDEADGNSDSVEQRSDTKSSSTDDVVLEGEPNAPVTHHIDISDHLKDSYAPLREHAVSSIDEEVDYIIANNRLVSENDSRALLRESLAASASASTKDGEDKSNTLTGTEEMERISNYEAARPYYEDDTDELDNGGLDTKVKAKHHKKMTLTKSSASPFQSPRSRSSGSKSVPQFDLPGRRSGFAVDNHTGTGGARPKNYLLSHPCYDSSSSRTSSAAVSGEEEEKPNFNFNEMFVPRPKLIPSRSKKKSRLKPLIPNDSLVLFGSGFSGRKGLTTPVTTCSNGLPTTPLSPVEPGFPKTGTNLDDLLSTLEKKASIVNGKNPSMLSDSAVITCGPTLSTGNCEEIRATAMFKETVNSPVSAALDKLTCLMAAAAVDAKSASSAPNTPSRSGCGSTNFYVSTSSTEVSSSTPTTPSKGVCGSTNYSICSSSTEVSSSAPTTPSKGVCGPTNYSMSTSSAELHTVNALPSTLSSTKPSQSSARSLVFSTSQHTNPFLFTTIPAGGDMSTSLSTDTQAQMFSFGRTASLPAMSSSKSRKQVSENLTNRFRRRLDRQPESNASCLQTQSSTNLFVFAASNANASVSSDNTCISPRKFSFDSAKSKNVGFTWKPTLNAAENPPSTSSNKLSFSFQSDGSVSSDSVVSDKPVNDSEDKTPTLPVPNSLTSVEQRKQRKKKGSSRRK